MACYSMSVRFSVYTCVWGELMLRAQAWVEDNLQDSSFPFRRAGPEDGTQVVRLRRKELYLLNRLAGFPFVFLGPSPDPMCPPTLGMAAGFSLCDPLK